MTRTNRNGIVRMKLGQVVRTGIMIAVALFPPSSASAQTRTTRDTATAYGARLTTDATPAAANRHRVNNRLNNRIANHLSLRIERYTPTTLANPNAAYTVSRDDGTRNNPTAVAGGTSLQRTKRPAQSRSSVPIGAEDDLQNSTER